MTINKELYLIYLYKESKKKYLSPCICKNLYDMHAKILSLKTLSKEKYGIYNTAIDSKEEKFFKTFPWLVSKERLSFKDRTREFLENFLFIDCGGDFDEY